MTIDIADLIDVARREAMARFDALPPEIRAAIVEADVNFDKAVDLIHALYAKGATAEKLAEAIKLVARRKSKG